MPEREVIERARRDAEEGKSPSTQAGEFVREEIEHVRDKGCTGRQRGGCGSSENPPASGLGQAEQRHTWSGGVPGGIGWQIRVRARCAW